MYLIKLLIKTFLKAEQYYVTSHSNYNSLSQLPNILFYFKVKNEYDSFISYHFLKQI